MATGPRKVMRFLDRLAAIVTIATALVAVCGYAYYRWTQHSHTQRLEALLAQKTQPNDDSLTVQQIAIALMLTESQVIEAASRSAIIESWAGQSGQEYRFRLKRK